MADQPYVDFAQLRRQLSIADVLEHLGWLQLLRGTGDQRRGPCPIHRSGQATERCFSVNLRKNVFRCFDPACGASGNVLDLWAAVHHQSILQAARELACRFQIHD